MGVENENLVCISQSTVATNNSLVSLVKFLVVIILFLILSNTVTCVYAWYVFNSYEYVTYEQDGEGVNNVNLGEMGDLINGAESQSSEEEGQIK